MGILLLVGGAGTGAAQSSDTTPMKSVQSGAYTAAQARSGEAVFSRVCAQCHAVAQFKDVAFQHSWAGRTARDLFELIRTQMPQDNPGTLRRDEYVAVLAYLFELSGYPPGTASLSGDDAALRRVLIERKPPAHQ
jgi:S-disulfanyl-L-cysteine oxidoreductase SoxD